MTVAIFRVRYVFNVDMYIGLLIDADLTDCVMVSEKLRNADVFYDASWMQFLTHKIGGALMKMVAVTVALLLSGCASNSGVMPIGQDTFMVSRQAATGFSGSGTLKAEAFQEATQYCTKQGQAMQVVNTFEASPPYILGNFPKAEVQFMCLNANDAELRRPKLHKNPDKVIEVKQGSSAINPGDTYTQLSKMKELLDSGTITQEEFNIQKKKILAN